ncbi:MAG: glycosyltransferase, partial [Novosphingobium sp.]|nr:glycosyltransferase [Novosphingobium sp.]
VFPSRTDTFGLVMIEAMACGVPVAAYPVQGPIDIVGAGGMGPDGTLLQPVGALDEDLAAAITQALACDRSAAAAHGGSYSWDCATDQFLDALGNAASTRDESRAA